MILRRLEGSRYSEIIAGSWGGAAGVALLGGGPSLTVDQVEAVRGKVKCVAVNNSYQLAPWADLLFADFANDVWRENHSEKVASGFGGEVAALESGADSFIPEYVHLLRQSDLPAQATYSMPSAGDTKLIAGRNSLHQALNLAVMAGATKILLLGCDGRRSDDGRSRWHGEGKRQTDDFFSDMRRAFSAQENALLSRGVSVVNCSSGSAIESFPKMSLADALSLEPDTQRDVVSA